FAKPAISGKAISQCRSVQEGSDGLALNARPLRHGCCFGADWTEAETGRSFLCDFSTLPGTALADLGLQGR
ncbi:MAG: hypothetical protein RLZZ444_2453, partial [Pseudomonadota bacterium]